MSINNACPEPLIKLIKNDTNTAAFGNCYFPCQIPYFTNEEYSEAKFWIAFISCSSFLLNVFVLGSLAITWKHWSAYPRRLVLYIHICFLLVSIGWTVQLWPDMYRRVVCLSDTTQRIAEPRLSGPDILDSLPCLVVFILIYFPLIAAKILLLTLFLTITLRLNNVTNHFMILKEQLIKEGNPSGRDCAGELWLMSVQNAHLSQWSQRPYLSCFSPHCFVWPLALLFTAASIGLAQIDGDPVSGLCFITQRFIYSRLGFVFLPVCVFSVAIVIILFQAQRKVRCLIKAMKQFNENEDSITLKSTLTRSLIGLNFCLFYVLLLFIGSGGFHIYHFLGRDVWTKHLLEKMMCDSRSKVNNHSLQVTPNGFECLLTTKPFLPVYLVHASLLFFFMLMPASLVFARRRLADEWKEIFQMCKSSPPNPPNVTGNSLNSLEFCDALSFTWWEPGVFFLLSNVPLLPVMFNHEVDLTTNPIQYDRIPRVNKMETVYEVPSTPLFDNTLQCRAHIHQTMMTTTSLHNNNNNDVVATLTDHEKGQEEEREKCLDEISLPTISWPNHQFTINHEPLKPQEKKRKWHPGIFRHNSDRALLGQELIVKTHKNGHGETFGMKTPHSFHYQTHYLPSSVNPYTWNTIYQQITQKKRQIPSQTSRPSSSIYSTSNLLITTNPHPIASSIPGSTSGQSYNSYHLLTACSGNKREEWKTRMRLLDALRWSNMAAAYLMQQRQEEIEPPEFNGGGQNNEIIEMQTIDDGVAANKASAHRRRNEYEEELSIPDDEISLPHATDSNAFNSDDEQVSEMSSLTDQEEDIMIGLCPS